MSLVPLVTNVPELIAIRSALMGLLIKDSFAETNNTVEALAMHGVGLMVSAARG